MKQEKFALRHTFSLPLILTLLGLFFVSPLFADQAAATSEETIKEEEAEAEPAYSSVDAREAEETLASKAAGSYERKSIAFLNAVWNLDRTFFKMPVEVQKQAQRGIRELFNNPRFDQNDLSPAMQERFVVAANRELARLQGKGKSMEVLTPLVEQYLLPSIVAAVEAELELRASGLLSEEQRNSFITDKAKELGVTALELEQVRNAAFLVIPVVEGWSFTVGEERISISVYLGAAIWRIQVRDGKARAVPVLATTAMGMGLGERKSPLGVVKATNAALKTALRNFEVDVKEIPEFQVSGQIASRVGSVVESDVGRKEGIRVDDKLRIVVQIEKEDGSFVQENQGWIRAVSIATEEQEAQGVKSQYAVVGGNPAEGDVLVEYPRLPLDVYMMWGYRPAKLSVLGVQAAEVAQQFVLGADYILGRSFGVSQLYFGFELGYSAFNDERLGSIGKVDLSLLLSKRISWGRFGLLLQGGAGYSQFGLNDMATDKEPSPANIFFTAGGGVDFALHPAWQLRTTVRWVAGSPLDDGVYSHEFNGLSIGVGFVWSPPGLPFDPANLMLGTF